jgi:hypothetical protein
VRWRLRWPWWHNGHEAAQAAEAAAEQLRQAKRRTAAVERLADEMGRLSSDEFLDRVTRAFGQPR